MSTSSKIEWTRSDAGTPGATWNPVTGCTEVSQGCDHCYAKTFAERWRGIPGHPFEQGFDVRLWPERLELPLRWRKPRRVFVNSMSDLFHPGVPDEFIARVFTAMGRAPQHTFQVLTKRPSDSFVDTARRCGAPEGLWPLPNVWLGVSVESQKWVPVRLTPLAATPAAVRFVSCEPLLGALDIRTWLDHGLDWVIAGGESGPRARPMHPDWARSLRDQCQGAGVPFFFKQWGQHQPLRPVFDDDVYNEHDLHIWPPGTGCVVAGDGSQPLRWTSRGVTSTGVPEAGSWWMSRTGKGNAGRHLDGRTWDEFPTSMAKARTTEILA